MGCLQLAVVVVTRYNIISKQIQCKHLVLKHTSPSFTKNNELQAPDWISTAIRGSLNPIHVHHTCVGIYVRGTLAIFIPFSNAIMQLQLSSCQLPGLLLYCVTITRQSIIPCVNCVSTLCLIFIISSRGSGDWRHHILFGKLNRNGNKRKFGSK